MSEREPDSHSEEPKSSERIGITYGGILAERMEWKRNVLGQFERVADLRTAVEITNSDNPERYDVVALGDTLALRKVGDVQDLFTRRQTPRRFLAVETNLSTARATITIDDQGLASEALKKGTKFDETLFTQKVNKLVKDGLRSVLSTEKRHQLNVSLKVDVGSLILFLPEIPGTVFFAEHLGIGNEIPMIEGVAAVLAGRVIGRIISHPIFTGIEKLTEESNFVYFEEFTNMFNSPKHLANLRQGRRFLATEMNKVVILKTSEAS
jgi:hypothetical protein